MVMEAYDPDAWNRFERLLRLRPGVELSYDDFRMAVEEIFNFELDHRSVSPVQLEVIDQLFNVVARYSPYPEDRAAYPGIYRDEQEVDNAIEWARQRLGIHD